MSSDKIRNVALIGHGGCGKTSLTEGLLFVTKGVSRLGRIEDGTTVSDYDTDEIKKKISITASLAPVAWNEFEVNVIDTPGYADFVGEVVQAVRVVDASIIVVSAVSGVEVGSERGWRMSRERHLPRAVFINKMDRESADFNRTLDAVRASFGDKAVAVQIPIGQEDSFRGVIDLLADKAYVYDGSSGEFVEEDVPAAEADRIHELERQLLERVVETDDELMEKYLEGEEIATPDLHKALNTAILKGLIYPVLCGSATKLIGLPQLLDMIVNDLPDPLARGPKKDTSGNEVALKADGPPLAFVFKTMVDPYVGRLTFLRVFSGVLTSDSHVWNANSNKDERVGQLFKMKGKEHINIAKAEAGQLVVVAKLAETHTGDTLGEKGKVVTLPPFQYPNPISFAAVEPKAKGDEEKIGVSLNKLAESDPTLRVERNVETHQTVVSGMGDNHLEITMERLKQKFGVEVDLSTPRVPYRETMRKSAKSKYKHKKQTGGRGQYAEVYLEVGPVTRGEGFSFKESIFGGAIPKGFIPAVEKGIRETLEKGVIAGFPVVDVMANCTDGSFHPVDSSELAFKLAAGHAFRDAFKTGDPVLLEPIQKVTVLVPERFMGDIMGDMNTRRGKIGGVEAVEGGQEQIQSMVPLAEMYSYAVDLTSMTGGRGTYTMEFDHYEEVPAHIAEKVIADRAAAAEKEKS